MGIVGGGQLARMMAESASQWGLALSVLASRTDDSAVATVPHFELGDPNDPAIVTPWAEQCDVVTFDHELVDLDLYATLEAAGVLVAPSTAALRFASSKVYQRETLGAAGVRVPRYVVLRDYNAESIDAFWNAVGPELVLKSDRGGYDGRGVVMTSTRDDAHDAARELLEHGAIVLEEKLLLLAEIAGVVVTGHSGERRSYPLVHTVQSAGMCVEVRYPLTLDAATHAEAADLVEKVASIVNAVGVMAVELFVTERGVILNEVATRPHNSGHWTIEGCVTSQFENHLRAVAGLPLGDVSALHDHVVMVNVVGSTEPGSLRAALALPGVHVHDYGKSWRTGRKLGHVTVVGTDSSVRVRAWEGAEALGTSTTRETT